MLTRLYIEALLVDEELADQVWRAWDAGEVSDRSYFVSFNISAFSMAIFGSLFLSFSSVISRSLYLLK